jgi:periplasmic protein TonB
MTGQSQTRSGELVATRAFRDGASAVADLSNVIPFARARRTGAEPYAPPVIVKPAERPAPLPPASRRWLQALLVVCSLIMHGGLLYLFWQDPQQFVGIGTEAITVEIEIGDSRPAGAAPKLATDQVDMPQVNEVKPDDKATEDEKAATEAREVKPDEMRTEVAKEQPVEQPKEQKPEERQQIAMVETQRAEVPTVRPRETPPDMQAVIAPPREQPQEATPVEPQQKAAEPSQAQEATSGVGSISVSAMASYNGRVLAHFKRHQQYPAAARNKSITGKGKVSFAIDGGGRVTSASVLIASGSPVLDEEMTAMVLRASPFPAPPDGAPKKFDVPVTFDFVDRK